MNCRRTVLLSLCAQLMSSQIAYKVSGTLVQHNSGQSMYRVRVTLSTAQSSEGQQASVLTEKGGRFDFGYVLAGKYTLSAEWHGMTQLLCEDEQYSTAIVTGPGLDTEHIVFPFVLPGSMVVKVTNVDGDPVQSASVFLFRKSVFEGWNRFELRGQVMTNLSGDASFTNLPPDSYVALVEGRPWYAQPPLRTEPINEQQRAIRAEMDVAYPPTYYGNVSEPQSPTPITVTEGGRVAAHVILRSVPAVQLELQGLETNMVQRSRLERMAMPFRLIEGPGSILVPSNLGRTQPKKITGIAPGRYILSVQQPKLEQNNAAPEHYRTGAADLQHNTTVNIQELRDTEIQGKLTTLGGERPGGLSVALENINNRIPMIGDLGADGAFQIGGGSKRLEIVLPGKYEVTLLNNPAFYIKSVSPTGALFRNGLLEIAEGAHVKLTIVVAKGTFTQNGLALKNGKPFANAMVLLVPMDRTQAGPILRDQSDSDGSFSLEGVPPGSYTAIAIDDGHELAYAEPGVIRPYLKKGLPLELPTARDTQLELTVQLRME